MTFLLPRICNLRKRPNDCVEDVEDGNKNKDAVLLFWNFTIYWREFVIYYRSECQTLGSPIQRKFYRCTIFNEKFISTRQRAAQALYMVETQLSFHFVFEKGWKRFLFLKGNLISNFQVYNIVNFWDDFIKDLLPFLLVPYKCHFR